MTENDILKEKYKHLTPAELANYGLLTPAKSSGYICPFCGNGNGEDGTGIDMSLLNSGYEGHCFKCGTDFDVFKIIAEKEHLDNDRQFAQVFQIAKEKFGDVPITKTSSTPKNEKPKKDFTENLKKWHENLKDFVKEQGGEFRGLLYEQLAKYYCGYEPKYYTKLKDDKGNEHTIIAPRFIVPSCRSHYLARLLPCDDLQIPDELKKELNKKSKQHFGTKTIFGKKLVPNNAKIIFVTEGEFDAMSIDQCGFPAVSVSGSKISSEMQAELKNFSADIIFVVLLDNDETGKENSSINKDILKSLGFGAVVATLDQKYKDANEFLQADFDGLKKNLEKIFEETKNNSEKILSEIKPAQPAKRNTTGTGFSTKEIIKNCPIDLEIPSGFLFSTNGIFKKRTDKEGNELKTPSKISDTPIVITRIIETPEKTEGQVEFAVYNHHTHIWYKHVISRADASDSKAMTRLAEFGVSVTTGRAKFLAEYFTDVQFYSTNLLKIPHTVIYDRPGWTNDLCEKFIHPAGDGENYVVNCKGFNYQKIFTVKGDKDIWLEKIFKRLFITSFEFRFTFGFMLSSYLLLPCNVRSFQLALISPSQKGKSACIKAVLSFQGNPEEQHRTWNTTANAANEPNAAFNDMATWLDEFQAAPKKIKENVEQIIYSFAENVGRARLNKDGSIKPVDKFRGNRIYSAEQPMLPPGAGQGAKARLIELESKRVLPDDIGLEMHQLTSQHYGHFFQDWINYIIKNKEIIKSDYQVICMNFSNAEEFTGKKLLPAHIQIASLTYTALNHFCQMLDLHDDEEMHVAEFIAEDCNYLLEKDILETAEETKNTTRALEFLAEVVETHNNFFAVESAYAKNNPGESLATWRIPSNVEILGLKLCKQDSTNKWIEGGDIMFYPSQLRRILEKDGGFPSANAIIKGLHDEGLLIESQSQKHKYQYVYKHDGKATWVYRFPSELFDL